MPARFVTTSLVTKCAGIAARFVTLVTKRAAVTKRATTGHTAETDVASAVIRGTPLKQCVGCDTGHTVETLRRL